MEFLVHILGSKYAGTYNAKNQKDERFFHAIDTHVELPPQVARHINIEF
jgi:hypothetical protein